MEHVDRVRRIADAQQDPRAALELRSRADFIVVPVMGASVADPPLAEDIARAEDLGEHGVLASVLHASSLSRFYRGDLAGARERIEAALVAIERVPADAPPFFEGVMLGFPITSEGPEGRPRAIFEETLFLFHRFVREPAVGYALVNLAMLDRLAGRREPSRALLEEALARFRHSGDGGGEAVALAALGNWGRVFGELDRGRAWLEEATALRRARGDMRATGMAEVDLALLLARAGALDASRTLFGELCERFRAADDTPGLGGALMDWGFVEEQAGELERAAALLDEGAELWAWHVHEHISAWVRAGLAEVLLSLGDTEGAAAAITRALDVLEQMGDVRVDAVRAGNAAAKALLSDRKAPSP